MMGNGFLFSAPLSTFLACLHFVPIPCLQTGNIAIKEAPYIVHFYQPVIIHLATSKIAILYGIDNGYLMPICMLLNDIAAALIGIAIIKYRLFDITVVIKRQPYIHIGSTYRIYLSLSEHLLATYVGNIFGEQSIYITLSQ